MSQEHVPLTVAGNWKTILGERLALGTQATGRDLWPVTAEDGSRYFLKRLGPWRNLPLADEARILRFLALQGIPVAEFMPADDARLYAGEIEDSFVLMPALANDPFPPPDLVHLEPKIGEALADLHRALARYSWPANSYVEGLAQSLAGNLVLPPDIAGAFARRRDDMISALTDLPLQLVHGDMTPENVLVRRPGEVSGFIDFDHLPLAPRIWDVSKYLSRRIRVRWRPGIPGAGEGRLEHFAGFLGGYHRANPFGAAEIAALPSGILAANVLEVSYFEEILAGTLIRRKMPDHAEVLADSIEAARWHLAHFDEVVDVVQSSFAGM